MDSALVAQHAVLISRFEDLGVPSPSIPAHRLAPQPGDLTTMDHTSNRVHYDTPGASPSTGESAQNRNSSDLNRFEDQYQGEIGYLGMGSSGSLSYGNGCQSTSAVIAASESGSLTASAGSQSQGLGRSAHSEPGISASSIDSRFPQSFGGAAPVSNSDLIFSEVDRADFSSTSLVIPTARAPEVEPTRLTHSNIPLLYGLGHSPSHSSVILSSASRIAAHRLPAQARAVRSMRDGLAAMIDPSSWRSRSRSPPRDSSFLTELTPREESGQPGRYSSTRERQRERSPLRTQSRGSVREPAATNGASLTAAQVDTYELAEDSISSSLAKTFTLPSPLSDTPPSRPTFAGISSIMSTAVPVTPAMSFAQPDYSSISRADLEARARNIDSQLHTMLEQRNTRLGREAQHIPASQRNDTCTSALDSIVTLEWELALINERPQATDLVENHASEQTVDTANMIGSVPARDVPEGEDAQMDGEGIAN